MVNLYPFEATVAKAGCTLADAIENIDIGGPAMVRSAAKNWKDVGVITSADQYGAVLAELKAGGKLSDKLRFALSVAAFNRIAQYDGAISDYLSSVTFEEDKLSETYVPTRTQFPGQSNGIFTKVRDLRYGENSHQQAALYRDLHPAPGSLVTGVQLQGKELSYNNIADADAAWECVKSFEAPACVIVKHANPCGVAVGKDAHEAYAKAFQTDPTSAFGGIIAFNRTVDKAAAEAVVKQFVEVLMAPDFTAEALEIFKPKVNVRLMKIAMPKVLHDVTARAIQVHGSLGISNEMPLGEYLTESFVMGIADGATEVHKANLAKRVLAGFKATDDLFPTEHLPRRRAEADAKFADVLADL